MQSAEDFESLDEGLPVSGVGDVSGDRLEPLVTVGSQLFEEIGPSSSRKDERAGIVQHTGKPGAETGGGAGHEGNATVERPCTVRLDRSLAGHLRILPQ